MQITADAINKRVWGLDVGRRRSGRSPLFEFGAPIRDGHPNLFDDGRIRQHELTERVAGDLQQLRIHHRSDGGIPRCSGQQRHLPEEPAASDSRNLLTVGSSNTTTSPLTTTNIELPESPWLDEQFALAEQPPGRGLHQLGAFLAGQRGEHGNFPQDLFIEQKVSRDGRRTGFSI